MPVGDPIPIPFPLSTFPGSDPQESEGRLINSYVEPLGDPKSGRVKWVRSAGLTAFAQSTNAGYRGGLVVNNVSLEIWNGIAASVDAAGNVTTIGTFPGMNRVSLARNQASPTPDVIAVDPSVGAYVLESATVNAATATATVGGTAFNSGDIVALTILNSAISPPFPVSISHTLGSGETATTVATALTAAINANATLETYNVTATSAGAVITISHNGAIGNQSSLIYGVTTGTETITFNPSSGELSGGQGTVGAFTGVPTFFNAEGILPQPNSVAFQDGYFFFTTGSGQVYATGINNLTVNALTDVTIQAKSDVTLLRAIAFSGLMLFFTTGSCEVWQDAANPAPNFPYSRSAVLEVGLLQASAIAGNETGFSELIWVGQDFAVHWMTASQLGHVDISTPDLQRLIKAAYVAGETLEADCYVGSGKKFWRLSSYDWTWEFNLTTKKWNERTSLLATGLFGRWRAAGGHPAFGKWIVGDEQTGDLLFVDDANPQENGAVVAWEVQSAPVKKFPEQQLVARADFDFVVGVGQLLGTQNPQVAIYMSRDGGNDWGNPLMRSLGEQKDVLRTRVTVTRMGVTGTMGARWRLVITDPVYASLLGGTMASALRPVGN